jgi:putative ABC transport system permease protein
VTDWIRDLHYSLRRLSRSPGFTLTSVLLLGLALAANVCVFSILYCLLYKPLPYRDADRLVNIVPHLVKENLDAMLDTGHVQVFSHMPEIFDRYGGFGYNVTQLKNGSATEPDLLPLVFLEPVVADMLGLQPLVGRLPTAEDVGVQDPGRIWVSTRFATEHFGSPDRAFNAVLALRLGRYQIAGVLRPNPVFANTQLWIPVAYTTEALAASADQRYGRATAIGRLAPGMSREEAGRRLNALLPTMVRGDEQLLLSNLRLKVTSLRTIWTDPYTVLILKILMAATGVIMLITAFNVSNLYLARLAARRHESALIAALGAGPARQLRLHAMDAVVLSGGGLALSLLLAPVGLVLLEHFQLLPALSPYPIKVDGMTQIFALSVAIALLGALLATALWMQRQCGAIQDVLKESGNRQTGGRGVRLARIGLTVSQVALTITLLVGAGLLMRSASRILHEKMGFERNHLVMSGVSLSVDASNYMTYIRVEQQFLERIARLPGVVSATMAACNPVGNGMQMASYRPVGANEADVASWPRANYCPETDTNYFSVMGTRIVAGRAFDAVEARSRAPVAIVDQGFVKANFPEESPLGREITINVASDEANNTGTQGTVRRRLRIVGVVETMKSMDTFVGFDQKMAVYVPGQQGGELLIRTSLDLIPLQRSLTAALHAVSPEAALGYTAQADTQISEFVQNRYPLNGLLKLLSLATLLLASVGLYAVLAYSVRMRTREFGVRLALGERPGKLRLGVALQGLRWAGVGAVIAVPLVWMVSRVVASMLYGIAPLDPVTLMGVFLIVFVVCMVASWWPARLASRIDPLSVLRAE